MKHLKRDDIIERCAGLLKAAIEATKVSEITVKEPGEPDKIFTTLQKQDVYDIIDACIKLVKNEDMIEND